MNKNLKVLLINPPWSRLLGHVVDSCPIGLSYLAGVLEKHGFDVAIYNADYNYKKLGTIFQGLQDMSRAYEEYLRVLQDPRHFLWQEVGEVISERAPDVVGISIVTGKYGSALNVAKVVRKFNPNIPIVAGGVHPTIMPEDVLMNEEIDIVVRGEGEYTLLDLMLNLQSQRTIENVLGISYKRGEKIIHNPSRPLIQDLDTLPFPAKHRLLEKETYPSHAFGRIFTSRGCPYKCIYCASHKIWTRKVRFRSSENVLDEIKYTKKTFGTSHFYFDDDTFTLNKPRIMRICDLLIADKIRISWGCEARSDSIDRELARKMKKAGCEFCNIGVESGDEATLIKAKKGITIQQIRNCRDILKDSGIAYNAYFMVGFPWETELEIKKTISLMKELQPSRAFYSIVTPYPGTELYEICNSEGIIPESIDWSTFFHQSPDMYLTKNLTKSKRDELIKYTEKVFDRYNKRQLIAMILTHPFRILKMLYRWGYTKPGFLRSLLRALVR